LATKTLRIDVKGIEELKKALSKIPVEAQPKVKKSMLEIMRVEVETKAKFSVPVDTGRLRSSIHTMEEGTDYKYSDSEGNRYEGTLSTLKVSKNEVAVGTNVNYADKIHKAGGRGGKGKKFLEIPFTKAVPNLLKKIEEVINK
jgi:phage gpG-like protein